MNIVIIEDEELAARRLESMVKNIDAGINIVAKLESVSDSVEWFTNNPAPDLIFLDIHLEDDLSLAIFDKVKISSPVVFTTATDELAIKAFKLEGIDYLLKPIIKEDLAVTLKKYKTYKPSSTDFSKLSKFILGRLNS